MNIVIETVFNDEDKNIIDGYKIICEGEDPIYCIDVDDLIAKLEELRYKHQFNLGMNQ